MAHLRIVRRHMRSILLASVVISLAACSNNIVEYTTDSGGHLRKTAAVSSEQDFQRYLNREIDMEARGNSPPAPYRGWREFWKAPHWSASSARFSTEQKTLAYVREQRKHRGLPPI